MNADVKRIGRIVGMLLLAQAVMAIRVYTQWGMMSSITAPDFLTEAAANATKIRAALVLTLVLSGITVAVALVALPVFRRASERMFWLYFGLAVSGLATGAIESVVVREMLAMSINYPKPENAEIYAALAPAVRAEWSAAHFSNLMMGHLKALILFLILYRFRFIPRWLAGAGVVATLISTTGVTASLVAVRFSYLMVAPAALIQMAMTLWLIWKGFSPPGGGTSKRGG